MLVLLLQYKYGFGTYIIQLPIFILDVLVNAQLHMS